MPKQKREQVDVTSALKNILDNYPAGSATLREILQNTDDAGATQQTFILDTRRFSSKSLVGSELRVCQGPAIIATNDGYFKPKDWEAIIRILDSSKRQDETSTGKYGLGFRSCYHVTDNPHILSGDKLLILDPHARVEKYQGGVELDTKNIQNEDGDIERKVYEDHFATFSAVFKQDEEVYAGTAIRLPLRLEGFESKLKSTPTKIEDARKMFMDFIAKELPEAMVFLKNITEIKLLEIDEKGNETFSATATIKDADVVASHRKRTKQGEVHHYPITITMRVGSAPPFTRSWIITQFSEKDATASGHLAKRLKRPQRDVEAAMLMDKLLPQVALALPLPSKEATSGPEFHGRLFTLLPLPITTSFPVHINAVLALVSSRQNLRNSMDVEAGSREELLVEWNRVIFSELVPKAWVSLLEHLASQSPSSVDVFEAWPGLVSTKDGDQSYWNPLPPRLLEEAVHRAVWRSHGRSSQYATLNGVLVAVEGESYAPLQALEACNIPLVLVPERVFSLIKQSRFKEAILSPHTVHLNLKRNMSTKSNLDAATRKLICDYLVSANDISLLDLPIIPQIQDKHTSISCHAEYVMATKSEAAIFGNVDQNLLAGDSMSAATRQLLLNDPAKRVRPVGPADVAGYLKRQVSAFGGTSLATISSGVDPRKFEWLVNFWTWLDGWDKLDQLVNHSAAWSAIQNLHALPLRLTGGRPALRLVGKSAVRPGSLDDQTITALAALKVPMLDASMSNGPAVRFVSKDHSDVTFILQSLPKNQSSPHIDQGDQGTRRILFEFFTQTLSNYLQPGLRRWNRVTLNDESRGVLRNLPIFPILSPGPRDDDNIKYNDIALGNACFVNDSVRVIPNIRDTSFVSYDSGRIFHLALEEGVILGEVDVLRKAISPNAWSQQDRVTGLLPALIDRLIDHLRELGETTRARISELAIVEVGAPTRRKSPNQVVDPSRPLAELYDAEDEVLPVGIFGRGGPGSYIHQLRNYNMLRADLTPPAVEERITRISNQSQPMNDRSAKALRLLTLLDSHTRSEGDWLPFEVAKLLRDLPWLPVANRFYTPSACWDSRGKDLLLCDMALLRVPLTVNSQQLRDYLGWNEVAFHTLQSQLLKVLETEPRPSEISETDILDRIEAVLKEIAERFQTGRLSEEQIESLAQTLGDAAWVPTNSQSRCSARQAVLEQIDMGMKYHSVAPYLLRFPGMEALLRQMGISNCPSQASLLSTLWEISNDLLENGIDQPTQNGLLHASIKILNELGHTIEGKESQYQEVLVPTEARKLALAREVLFNDVGRDPTAAPPGFQFAHPLVSASLASTLNLRRLSEEDFAEGEDGIESFHLEEDLTVRIRGVLQDYGIDHSSNEWVANAEDAGARSLTYLVDEASFGGEDAIPELTCFQSGPALVMHNDGVFTDKDFSGLGNIGQGGKAGSTDSIGRFGLGALSFYHFSEVPWVVSGKWCLFLDPSKRYLPRLQGNVRRNAVVRSISYYRENYPDQLRPLEGLFGFSSDVDYYKGTLFRLPLRTADQAAKSKLSATHFSPVDITNQIDRFYAFARQSLFFPRSLRKITALRRTPDLRTIPFWSACVTREPIPYGVPGDMDAVNTFLALRAPHSSQEITEHWVVTRNEVTKEKFPAELQALFPLHRLPTPTFGLAVNLSVQSRPSDSRLFATLPLPVATSLPVHIHATWILAQDRRSIRYDAPDAAGQRPDDTVYNQHLLEKGVAPLYVRTLALILQHHPKVVRLFWPGKPNDDISRTVFKELYEQIISTKEPVLLTVRDERITPTGSIIHSTKAPVGVRKMLSKLQVPNYVPDPFIDTSFRDDWGTLRFDSGEEVSRILQENVVAMRQLWQAEAFTLKDILSVLNYLMEEKESLDGIPLLVRGDRELVEFRSSGGRRLFASHRTELAELFGPSTVVSLEISDLAAQNLVKQNVNVGTLDSRGMQDLLLHRGLPVTPVDQMATSGTQRDWHNNLLKFLASPDCPVKVQDLADYPLLPAVGQDLVVSLNHARGGTIWWRHPHESRALTTVLLQLGVISVDDLPEETQEPDVNDLTRILRLFGQLNLPSEEVLRLVARKDWDAFVQYLKPWIQDFYLKKLSECDLQVLNTLPFFQGRQGNKPLSYVPASQVMMLPNSVPLNSLARYLPHETTFAESGSELAAVLRASGNTQMGLSFPNLFSQLRIPRQLAQDEDASFSSLLPLVATHHTGTYDNRLIPDGNLVPRRPSELFDHRITLFSTAYEGRKDLFVHPNFRDLIDRLVDLGVQREVTSQRLLECIQAIDQEARQGREVVRRARWLWAYVNAGPQALREISFDTIRTLCFIPRHIQRHPSDSNFDVYAGDLPDVVSPDELCVPNREAVAWTQRARFVTLPSAHLTAIYPEFGEPSPNDVVRHLTSLANHVAHDRQQSSILLSNIRSVYRWLGDNRDNVTGLLSPLANQPLWLNISSDDDDWTWRAADELVFDLTFDVGGRFVVQDFLAPYRSLLVEAGAHEYHVVTPPPPSTSEVPRPHLEQMRSGWNTLRSNGLLLDICFQVEGQEIPAHRGMLAALVDHFMVAFSNVFSEITSFSNETNLPVYPLPQDDQPSAFAVQSVVDYVYTGAFCRPEFSNLDEADAALDDLLNLMELSILWDIPELSNQTVDVILALRLIRFDNCQDVLARAEACQMEVLVNICQGTIEQNHWGEH